MTGRVGTVVDILNVKRPPRVLVRLDPFVATRWQETPSEIRDLEVIYAPEDLTEEAG